MMVNVVVRGVVACLAGLFVVAAVTADAQETLELGVPLPLAGLQARFGEIEKWSYEIAMEEINAAGGIKGRKVVLRFEDSRDRPAVSRSIVRKLVDAQKQPILFGEYSSACSRAVAELANEKKVPYLVVTGAADVITQEGFKYVFRMNPPNAYYASGLVSFLAKVVKPRTAAVLYEESEFGISSADAFSKAAEKAGISVVYQEPYANVEYLGEDFVYTPEVKVSVNTLKALKPDVIFMASYYKDAVKLMNQMKKYAIEAKIYAGGAAGFAIPDFLREGKGSVENVVTAALWSPGLGYPGAREFAEKYKKRHREYPSYHGAEAYSALHVVKDVLERAKTWTPEDVRDALNATSLMTAFGPVKFETRDEYDRQNFLETIVLQVIDGQFEVVWPERHATKKYVYPLPR
jgi:branched-chain amino acid transport system substrate-binding protein